MPHGLLVLTRGHLPQWQVAPGKPPSFVIYRQKGRPLVNHTLSPVYRSLRLALLLAVTLLLLAGGQSGRANLAPASICEALNTCRHTSVDHPVTRKIEPPVSVCEALNSCSYVTEERPIMGDDDARVPVCEALNSCSYASDEHPIMGDAERQGVQGLPERISKTGAAQPIGGPACLPLAPCSTSF